MKATKKNIILIGGGGHCKSCIDVIESTGIYKIEGVIDLPEKKGQKVMGYDIIGTDNDILDYKESGYWFIITLGQIKSALPRTKMFNFLKDNGAMIATVVSPYAHVSTHAEIATGTIVMHNVIVNAGAKVGENCILNTGCCIEHDAVIGNNCHIATYSVINGDCNIGNATFIGSNTTISNQINIIENTVVGAGAVVTKSIITPGIYIGNPAKKKGHE